MKRILLLVGFTVAAILVFLNLVLGWFVLPRMLLAAPTPNRTEFERTEIRSRLCPPECYWTSETIPGGEGIPIVFWRLHRTGSHGVVVILHGFGDDAWGAASRLQDLPGFDAVTFTFRNRDLAPGPPSTLGGWESWDVVAVINRLAAEGVPRKRILLVGTSQGAGVALLALEQVERDGRGPLGGALLESPYEDLVTAARNHLRGTLGGSEWLLRPAERLALIRAGHVANLKPMEVSPAAASRSVKTPVALLAGDADDVTPLQGVLKISAFHPDLTIVHGAHHLEAGSMVVGGWKAWARPRLARWGFQEGH